MTSGNITITNKSLVIHDVEKVREATRRNYKSLLTDMLFLYFPKNKN
jgi:hypothetical protein